MPFWELIHQAHRRRHPVAVVPKAGAGVEGQIVAVDDDGFELHTGAQFRWDDVWSVFAMPKKRS